MYLQPLIFLLPMLAWLAFSSDAPLPQTLRGCEDHCGNISIPYPFGTKEGCYIDGQFLVTCNRTNNTSPKLFLMESTIEITDIFLSGELRILASVGFECYNQQGDLRSDAQLNTWIKMNRFIISDTRNKFIAVGCDTSAVIKSSDRGIEYTTGCMSLCGSINNTINGSCTGIGCCKTDIPPGVRSFNITFRSFDNHTLVRDFNPCSFAFVAEESSYNFISSDLYSWRVDELPVVLDWAVGYETCDVARNNLTSYACKDEKSICYDFENGVGYRCNCSEGYEGNPYLSNGCRDIDECKISRPCNMTCLNLPGTYNCSCFEGYEGDGKINGSGCSRIPVVHKKFPVINIALGISIGISVLLLGSSWLYWVFRQRKIIKLREKFFQQNGGIMLQEKLSKREGSIGQSAKIFVADDLKKATNNYHESRVLGKGGQGTVYKGILPDKTIVAIKKSNIVDKSQIQQFINEVIILSQVNHRNVVKLLGCCLETEVPLLVYEFVTNGTLYDHIHKVDDQDPSITWNNRLRIATETASALSYLHSAASTPIIHRDVKTANILLDDNYNAKVSDFGASKLIPIDQNQLTTLVQGTFGYLDPEYYQTSQLTEKSDVYSFGVLLVELLTGKKALSFDRPENERILATFFVSSMKEDRLLEIVDKQVMNEATADQLKEVAILAKRCLSGKGDERPTMKEVTMELEGLRMMDKHPWVNDNMNLEESEYLLGELPNTYDSTGSIGSSMTAHDSTRNHVISPFDGGR